jgi:hypothetical protein
MDDGGWRIEGALRSVGITGERGAPGTGKEDEDWT